MPMDLVMWTHLIEGHELNPEARDWVASQTDDYLRGLHDGMHGRINLSPALGSSNGGG